MAVRPEALPKINKGNAELTVVFAHPVLARLRALAVNPNLNRSQLLGIAPVDDPESVLIACAKRVGPLPQKNYAQDCWLVLTWLA